MTHQSLENPLLHDHIIWSKSLLLWVIYWIKVFTRHFRVPSQDITMDTEVWHPEVLEGKFCSRVRNSVKVLFVSPSFVPTRYWNHGAREGMGEGYAVGVFVVLCTPVCLCVCIGLWVFECVSECVSIRWCVWAFVCEDLFLSESVSVCFCIPGFVTLCDFFFLSLCVNFHVWVFLWMRLRYMYA